MYECNCIEEQQAEIELLEAAFGSSFQLLNNNDNYDVDVEKNRCSKLFT
jgi:hypothetical protein